MTNPNTFIKDPNAVLDYKFDWKPLTNGSGDSDWLDTAESQRLLNYQTHTLDDYLKELRALIGWRLPFIRAFRPFVRSWLLKQSPYLHTA